MLFFAFWLLTVTSCSLLYCLQRGKFKCFLSKFHELGSLKNDYRKKIYKLVLVDFIQKTLPFFIKQVFCQAYMHFQDTLFNRLDIWYIFLKKKHTFCIQTNSAPGGRFGSSNSKWKVLEAKWRWNFPFHLRWGCVRLSMGNDSVDSDWLEPAGGATCQELRGSWLIFQKK